MYRRAAVDHALDLSRSGYIGDRWRDVQPAVETGGVGVLVPSVDTSDADVLFARAQAYVMPSLGDAVSHFLATLRPRS